MLFNFYGRSESEFIKDIVEDVLKKVDIRCPPIELKGLVGIERNYEEVKSLLEIGSREEVRVIGIWGMGGIGKTTWHVLCMFTCFLNLKVIVFSQV